MIPTLARSSAPRVPVHAAARFRDRHGEDAGTLFDLSSSGALLSTSAKRLPGTAGTLVVRSYRSRTAYEFSCRVARVAKQPAVGIGLVFTDMGTAARLWLSNYCSFFAERRRVVMVSSDAAALTMLERILTTEGFKFVGIETESEVVKQFEGILRRIEPALVIAETGPQSSSEVYERLLGCARACGIPGLLASHAPVAANLAAAHPVLMLSEASRSQIVTTVSAALATGDA